MSVLKNPITKDKVIGESSCPSPNYQFYSRQLVILAQTLSVPHHNKCCRCCCWYILGKMEKMPFLRILGSNYSKLMILRNIRVHSSININLVDSLYRLDAQHTYQTRVPRFPDNILTCLVGLRLWVIYIKTKIGTT